MTTRTRWIIGILVVLVIGLAVGLVIVAADPGGDDSTTVTVQETEPTTTETEPTTTETEPTTTETEPEDGDSGGVQPDGSGGLGY